MILGDVYRERGDAALARAAYEEAARRGDAMGDLQALVPSLAGLARVLAGDDPEQAGALARRAADYGAGMGEAAALLAVGYVALAAGDRGAAAQAAAQAGAAARGRRDRARMAEALELEGLAAPERPRARRGAASRRSPSGTSSATRSARRARSSRSPRRLTDERGAAVAARPRDACASSARARRWTPSIPSPRRRWRSRRSGAFACCATAPPSRARRGARARRATC